MFGFGNLFVDRSADEVSVDEVAAAITADSHTILDVREPDEWEAGHIAEAVHIPLGDLEFRIQELPAGKPVYTVCRSCKRSLVAVDILAAGGIAETKSMAGGMIAWAEAGKPYI